MDVPESMVNAVQLFMAATTAYLEGYGVMDIPDAGAFVDNLRDHFQSALAGVVSVGAACLLAVCVLGVRLKWC